MKNKLAKIRFYLSEYTRNLQFGWLTAFKLVFVSSRMGYVKCESYKRKLIYCYLDKYFADIKISDKPVCPNDCKIIWMMWWQGKEKMPPIVRACYQSVIANKPEGYKVELITQANWQSFFNLPDVIINRFESGKITLTHLSDIIRFNLILKYGGIWLDATIFLSNKVLLEYFKQELFSLKIPYNDGYISMGKWSGFAIGMAKDSPLFEFGVKCLNLYWKKHTDLIDYYLIDYIIRIAYERNLRIKRLIEDNMLFCNDLYVAQKALNIPATENVKKILAENIFHKLTWKGLLDDENTQKYLISLADKMK